MRIKFRLQLVVVNDSGQEHVQEVARIERDEVVMETLELTLAEGKLILKRIRDGVVQEQIQDYSASATELSGMRQGPTKAKGITTSRCARCLGTSS